METDAQTLPKSHIWRVVAVIFVMLGTGPYPFGRLLSAVDTWAKLSGQKVIAQNGHTQIPVEHIECRPFLAHEEVRALIAAADMVIAQGGFGSLGDCLAAGKPTIAVPRLPRQGECKDEQSELVAALAAENLLIAVYDVADLPSAIEVARASSFSTTRHSEIPTIVAEAVDKMTLGRRPA